jgi:transposase-like protein
VVWAVGRWDAMARYRSHSLEFKRHIAQNFPEGRAGMREVARRHNLSRNPIRFLVGAQKTRSSRKMISIQ